MGRISGIRQNYGPDVRPNQYPVQLYISLLLAMAIRCKRVGNGLFTKQKWHQNLFKKLDKVDYKRGAAPRITL